MKRAWNWLLAYDSYSNAFFVWAMVLVVSGFVPDSWVGVRSALSLFRSFVVVTLIISIVKRQRRQRERRLVVADMRKAGE